MSKKVENLTNRILKLNFLEIKELVGFMVRQLGVNSAISLGQAFSGIWQKATTSDLVQLKLVGVPHQRIPVIKLLRELDNYSLLEAKQLTDRVLDGKRVSIGRPFHGHQAREWIIQFKSLGAEVETEIFI